MCAHSDIHKYIYRDLHLNMLQSVALTSYNIYYLIFILIRILSSKWSKSLFPHFKMMKLRPREAKWLQKTNIIQLSDGKVNPDLFLGWGPDPFLDISAENQHNGDSVTDPVPY